MNIRKLASTKLLGALLVLVFASRVGAEPYHFTSIPNFSAYAINDAGQVVGTTLANVQTGPFTFTPFQHAAVWNGSSTTELVGGRHSNAVAINDSGQIAGSDNINRNTSGFRWSNGAVTALPPSRGASLAFGLAINDAGKVAGWDSGYATVWTGTTPTRLSTPALALSFAFDINNNDQVVGSSGGFLDQHATLWIGGVSTDLGTLGGSTSEANAISSNGRIVGNSTKADNTSHATLWNGTITTDLGTLSGFANSSAIEINEAGDIVGTTQAGINRYFAFSSPASKTDRAILWRGSTAFDLNTFLDGTSVSDGRTLLTATGINNNGWIVGDAFNSVTGVTTAYLLAPVPEPEIYATLFAGLGVVGFVAARRRIM